MSLGEFSLAVPASPVNLEMIRGFVTEVGDRAGLSKVEINRLELAVDEACSNVIEHGNLCHGLDKVTVTAAYDEKSIRVSIIDPGTHFDPRDASVTSLEVKKLKRTRRQPVRGLGIPMLRSLIDHIDYHVLPDNTNELKLVLRKA